MKASGSGTHLSLLQLHISLHLQSSISTVYLGSFDVAVLDVLLETVLTQTGITDLFSKFIKGKSYAPLD